MTGPRTSPRALRRPEPTRRARPPLRENSTAMGRARWSPPAAKDRLADFLLRCVAPVAESGSRGGRRADSNEGVRRERRDRTLCWEAPRAGSGEAAEDAGDRHARVASTERADFRRTMRGDAAKIE
jgi:hypothetical protein